MSKSPIMMLSIESTFLTTDTYAWFYEMHSILADSDKKISSPGHFIKLINSFRTIFKEVKLSKEKSI